MVAALDGIRVLDLSRVLAGPFCGQLLADNGADVIKVEALEGDQNRAFPMVLAPGESTNFLSVNRGKRDIALNLKTPEARALVHRLVARMDVVIQSFLPDTAARLGVDYETLQAINPDLVYVSISGYGARGPLRNKAGYDMMVAAYAGITALTGAPDGPPVRPGVTVVDLSTGMLAYSGVVTALLARAAGKAGGQRVDVSLLESAVTLLGFHAVNWTVAGVLDRREGAGYRDLAPYDSYRCGDGDILIGAPTQAAWLKVCDVLGRREWAEDPAYATNPDRCANRDRLRADLEAVLATRPVAHWLERLEAAGVAAAPINTLDTVLADPQVLANDMVLPARHSDGREVSLVGVPFKLSATPAAPGAAPPGVGEHTEEILRELLGLEGPALEQLRKAGAINR